MRATLSALAWEARQRGVSYGELVRRKDLDETDIMRRYNQAFGRKVEIPVVVDPETDKKLLELYDKKCPDKILSELTGVSLKKVRRWRRIQGLQANLVRPEDSRFFRAWEDGLTDAEIAEMHGVSRAAVSSWRDYHHLPCNFMQGRTGND